MTRKLIFIAWLALALPSLAAVAQEASARTVQYHSQDIVPIHAKLKYTTLIEVPPTEKIMEAAIGDKDFWIVDVVGNFCFVHPAKAGISSNLNLITDKGNIYSFTLEDVSGTSAAPDLKVLIEPADHSSIVAASGPPQFVPAAQLEQSRQQLAALQSHVEQAKIQLRFALAIVRDRLRTTVAPFFENCYVTWLRFSRLNRALQPMQVSRVRDSFWEFRSRLGGKSPGTERLPVGALRLQSGT